ncbi:Mitochondrial transcription termination factor family protein, putative isoform 1 [Hibiscus syriacus]|uniref:Mitochondrial transcription termination factor family protein, putative isoform 1 n=1 Tax=Hibiscus syriacus TaxID=106335 RepID=A0A6A3C9J9_HIBSY|nr:Mitochondrial transcription termination factor family protein, putative isoform 1 [Hibiscus syriacus]
MLYFLCKTILHGRNVVTATQSSKLLGLSVSNSQIPYKATRYVHFESPEKPDSVLAVLKNHGFSKPQITRLIKGRPAVLTSNVEKTILPKLEFLISKVAECNIASTFCSQPTTFFRSPRKFKDMVKETKEMGFTPSKPLFMEALYAMSSTSKPTWKRKIDFFKKFGWSEEEVFEAFRRYPSFISFSEYRYMMSWEKKTVPRGLFALDLLSKGVIKRIYLSSLFGPSDHVFIENFINCHKSEASQLLNLYHEKLDLSKNWRVDGCKLQHL